MNIKYYFSEYHWSDAELLFVAYSVAKKMGLKVSFQINHTEILKIVLLSCGISADKHVDFYPVLVEFGTGMNISIIYLMDNSVKFHRLAFYELGYLLA